MSFKEINKSTNKVLVRNAEQALNPNAKAVKDRSNLVKGIMKKPSSHENIKAIEREMIPEYEDRVESEKEITKRLTFHFNQKLYKDPVAVDIPETAMGSCSIRGRPLRTKFVPPTNKDVEPNLNDLYEDVACVDKPLLVTAPKVKLTPVVKYVGTDVHRKIQSWKVSS